VTGKFVAVSCFVVFALFAPLDTLAQDGAASKHEFSVWGARSFTNGHAFGFSQDRSLAYAAFRYGRSIGDLRRINFRYVIEARPIAVLGDLVPVSGRVQRVFRYAGGFSPIGLQMTFAEHNRVHPFLASNGGFLYFNDRVLDPAGTQFQFTIYIAAGIEILATRNKAVKFGYLYHHFSNANIHVTNPAVDTHTIFAGFSWYR
jgi:hypothetical protein